MSAVGRWHAACTGGLVVNASDRAVSRVVSLRTLPEERPRERLLLQGPARLSTVELVALLLGGGHSLRRAMALLERTGGLAGLASCGPHELMQTPGVGDASAAAVCSAVELGRRVGELELPTATALRDPGDVSRYVRSAIGAATQELFLVLGLDARQRVRMVRTVGMGSLAQVDVHPREVFRPLVRAGMHAVILVHNHPSGDAEPSEADIELTHRLAEVGRVLGIPVLDHLVVTVQDAVSLAALGLL